MTQFSRFFINKSQSFFLRLKPIIDPLFISGNARTVRARKNIFALLILRGISLIIGFLIVPLTLHYLSPIKYGIWLTISSMVGWFTFFDIGLGNGFRNKFAEAKAKNDFELARIYVSTDLRHSYSRYECHVFNLYHCQSDIKLVLSFKCASRNGS